MRKILFTCLLIIAAARIASAQTNTSAGTVKDDKGNPLRYVFVEDNQYKTATFTDSLGNYTIVTHPDSKLGFELGGYKNALVDVDKNNSSQQIALIPVSSSSSNGSVSTKSTSSDLEFERNANNGLADMPGHKKGNVHGNRYIFDDFVHGFILTSTGSILHNPDYLFDYDKMDGYLLITKDKKAVSQVSYDQAKSFTLFSNTDQSFVFEKLPAIDNTHYMLVLSSGKKYKIYKFIKTKFVKSDYVNNGMASHGNDYDEYTDDADYYVLDLSGTQPQKISLKKKSIKAAFPKDADKINKYLSDNSQDIDDAYLSKMGDFMNQ